MIERAAHDAAQPTCHNLCYRTNGLCLSRAKAGEALVEAHKATDLCIVCQNRASG